MSGEKQSPKRVKSAGTATGVLQKTHGFFSTLRVGEFMTFKNKLGNLGVSSQFRAV